MNQRNIFMVETEGDGIIIGAVVSIEQFEKIKRLHDEPPSARGKHYPMPTQDQRIDTLQLICVIDGVDDRPLEIETYNISTLFYADALPEGDQQRVEPTPAELARLIDENIVTEEEFTVLIRERILTGEEHRKIPPSEHVRRSMQWEQIRMVVNTQGRRNWCLIQDGMPLIACHETANHPDLEKIRARNARLGIAWPYPDPDEILLKLRQEDQLRGSRPRKMTAISLTMPLHFSTHGNLNTTMGYVWLSRSIQWQYDSILQEYFLQTPTGRVVAERISTLPMLQKLLSLVGVEGLQYTCAAIAFYTEIQRAKHGGILPEYQDCTPVTIHGNDLMRAMGRANQGIRGGYSQHEQLRARNFLCAASHLNFNQITPTSKHSARLNIGPILSVLDTELERLLPLDGIDDHNNDVISLTIMPGKGFWELVRSGAHWVPLQLLRLHPVNDKYAIAAGFYLANLLMIRSNKPGQAGKPVSIGQIDREACIEAFDKRAALRLRKLEKALDKLAAIGVIGGNDGAAVFLDDHQGAQKSTAEALRARRLILTPPAGLQQLTRAEKALPDGTER